MITCSRQLHVISCLATDDADLDLQSDRGITALIYACAWRYKMDPSIPVLLLSAGVRLNAVSFNGCTVLMRAVSILPSLYPTPLLALRKVSTQVDTFLYANADVNIYNEYGDNAVHLAAQRGQLSITELLLAASAGTSLYGETALDLPMRLRARLNT